MEKIEIKKEGDQLFDLQTQTRLSDQKHKEENDNRYRQIELRELYQAEANLKKDIVYWTLMADFRLELVMVAVYLFFLLLVFSLAGAQFSGPNPDGLIVLGWVSCVLAVLCYLATFLIAVFYVPYLEILLSEQSCQWIRLFKKLQQKIKTLQSLTLQQLVELLSRLESQGQLLRILFPEADLVLISQKIKNLLGGNEQKINKLRTELEKLKTKESNAKWWEYFWLSYVLNKTINIPNLLMLVFGVTTMTNATKQISISMNNAQGWLSVGFWLTGILFFVFIKLVLWDRLKQNTIQAKADAFYFYANVYLKSSKLEDLTLTQLQAIDKMLRVRGDDFEQCFADVKLSDQQEQVKQLIASRLPERESEDQDRKLNEIVQLQTKLKNTYSVWLDAFNTKIIPNIMTSNQFYIVIATTFAENYPTTEEGVKQTKIILGIVSLACMALGYIFFVICGRYLLDYLQTKTYEGRSSPFVNYRLVYFGNQSLWQFEVHQLEEILQITQKRRDEFIECFPKIRLDSVQREIEEAVQRKKANCSRNQSVVQLLKEEENARKKYQFWVDYENNSLFCTLSSTNIEYATIMVTFAYDSQSLSKTLGWIGIGVLITFIVTVIFFHWKLLPDLRRCWKAHSINGYSEFNLVFKGQKQLDQIELKDLKVLKAEIQANSIEFKRCFPGIDCQELLKEINHCIQVKTQQNMLVHQFVKEEFELEKSNELLTLCSKALREKLFSILPITMSMLLLLSQSIASDKTGITVTGFLGVAALSVSALLLLMFNLWVKERLLDEIKSGEKRRRQSFSKKKYLSGYVIETAAPCPAG